MTLTLAVERENVRDAPGGKVIGSARRGETFTLLQRRGDWCRVDRPDTLEGWIWAPSLGLARANPMWPLLWLGGEGENRSVEEITSLFGPPTAVQPYGAEIYIYRYVNLSGTGGASLFGTRGFRELRLWVDRPGRTAIRLEMDLPPLRGKAEEILGKLGFSAVRSTGSDFERARYEGKLPGIAQLDLLRHKGNFTLFSRVVAEKYPPRRWVRWVKIRKRRAVVDGKSLEVVLTLTGGDPDMTWAAPRAEIGLFEGSRRLGEWELGPADLRLEPGREGDAVFPVPLDASAVDPAKLSVTAKLIGMLPVPRSAPAAGEALP